MTVKRTNPRVVFVVLALLLAACGGQGEEPQGAGTDPDPEPPETETAEEEDEPAPPSTPEETEEAGTAHGFEDGDELTIIVSSPPGGGFDTQARALAPALERAMLELTGKSVSVLVQNMPGGNHTVAAGHVYRSEPDGKTIMFNSLPSTAENLILQDDFDMREVTGLGSAGTTSRGIVARTDLGLEEYTLEALVERSQEQPILFGNPGNASSVALFQLLLDAQGLTFDADHVSFEGTSDITTALLREDIEAAMSTSVAMAEFVEDNPDDVRWVVDLGCESPAPVPAPTIVEEGIPDAETICSVVGGFARVFFGPPDMDPAVVSVMNDALRTALEDDEYVGIAESADLLGTWADHATVDEWIAQYVESYLLYSDQVDEIVRSLQD